jgi:hypothetical protein
MTVRAKMPATDSRKSQNMHPPRRPPLCYTRARPPEVIAAHPNAGKALLASLTIGTAAVLWFVAYSGLHF